MKNINLFCFFQIFFDILFKFEFVGDLGIMCFNMNIINNINVKIKNVLDNFNYCKDFVELEIDVFIVVVVMKYFNMKFLEDY